MEVERERERERGSELQTMGSEVLNVFRVVDDIADILRGC